ncbi:MAG TPA: PhnD/SsuA/transferrin family substrate-binding protein [Dongiaceae bacterium]|nr:PhnD/SsuA/transferrin family substrate-binding protein [Dongiaceae bacterium]
MTLELSLACQNTDRTRALFDGRVTIEGCRVNLITAPAEEIFQRAFRHQEFDISELSFSTHLLTTARGQGRYIGLPAFVSRSFRHSAIYVRADRDIDSPEALRGRRVGVPDFQQTAGVWVRGLLAEQYGVRRQDIHWLTGGLEQPGRTSRMPLDLPRDIKVEAIGQAQTLSGLLLAGEIDALIAPRAPSCFAPDGVVRRLFADYRAAEEDYFQTTRLFPIMHLMGIRRELAERHPWLPVNVYTAFLKARALAISELDILDTLRVTHPWIVEEVGRVKALMGNGYWTYGVEENKGELNALLRYAEADGLIRGPVPMEELFAVATFDGFNF